MVHTFNVNGDNLVLDTQTSSLFMVDDIALDIINLYVKNDGIRPDRNLLISLNEYSLDEIENICNDIDSLIKENCLFVPEKEYNLEDFYPDKPRIKALCLHLCHDCNLRCKYCFAGTGDYHTGVRSFLSYETGIKAIDFVVEQSGGRKNIDIDFFGGEPLMNWEVVVKLTYYCEEQSKLKGKNIRLTITTNCVLLDEEKIKFINEHMENCVLSIDGRKEVQDNMRPAPNGKGSYDLVTKNIKKFIDLREDGTYYLRGTYTRNNLDFTEDVKTMLSLGAKHVSIEPVVAPESEWYSLREEDLAQIFAEYEKLAKYKVKEDLDGNHFEFFHFSVDLSEGPCAYKRLKGCGVGSEYIAITPEGDIYPCHQLTGEKEFLIGNVNDSPVVINPSVVSRFSKLLVPQKEECKSCWARYFCSGGCPANAFHATGSIDGVHETGCAIQKKRIECALWVKAVEKN